jgi:hypothetical protein
MFCQNGKGEEVVSEGDGRPRPDDHRRRPPHDSRDTPPEHLGVQLVGTAPHSRPELSRQRAAALSSAPPTAQPVRALRVRYLRAAELGPLAEVESRRQSVGWRLVALTRRFECSARCTANHGVASKTEPVAPVGDCSMPVTEKVARQRRSSWRVRLRSKPWGAMSAAMRPMPVQGPSQERTMAS